jgi:oligosaccharide repeat unit polymerase
MSRSALTSLFIATVILVVAMGAMLVVPSSSHVHNIGATFVLALALAISGWQLTMAAVAPRPAAASMMVHLFFVFFLIVPALFQLATDTYALDMSIYKEGTTTKAAVLVLLFVVCFVLGGMIGPKNLGRAMQTIKTCERRRRGIIVIAFILFAVAVALAAIMAFGLDTLIANRSSLKDYLEEEETKATAGLFLDLPRAITFCGVLALLYLFGRRAGRQGGSRRTMAILLALMILPLFVVVNYPQAQARFWLFGMAIVIALLYVDMRHIRMRLLMIAGIGAGAYTIFPLVRTLTTAEVIGPDMEVMSAEESLFTGNFDGFEMIMNIVIAAERFGYTLGRQLGSALLFFVPRSLWEGKAYPTGYYTAEKLGYHFTNLSAPAVGELYLDFSYLGVVLGGLAIGYVYRKADTLYAAALAFGGVSLHRILTAMLCGFTIILMRGALLAIIALIATSFVAIALLIVGPRLARFLLGR